MSDPVAYSAERWVYLDATVTRVVDGDTFLATVARAFDLGFHVTLTGVATQRFRLVRVNAPPLHDAGGAAAQRYLIGLVTGVAVTIESVGPYKYGDEWVCELTLPDGRNVSDVMVTSGHAVYWDGHGPRPGGTVAP